MKKRELEALTVVQLRVLARKRGVRLRGRLKSEIVQELAQGLRAPRAAARKTTSAGRKGEAGAGRRKRDGASPEGLTRKDLRAQTVAGLRATAKSLGVRLAERRKEAIIGEILREARKAARAGRRTAPPKGRTKVPTAKKPVRPGRKSAARPVGREKKAQALRRAGGPHVLGSVPPSPPERRDAPVGEASSDTVTAIAVEPREIFVWWQLTAESLSEGKPGLRAYRVRTRAGGKEPGGLLFHRTLSQAEGSAFLMVPPGEEMFIALGVVTRGRRFTGKARSMPFVTPPESYSAEEARLPDEYFIFHPLPY